MSKIGSLTLPTVALCALFSACGGGASDPAASASAGANSLVSSSLASSVSSSAASSVSSSMASSAASAMGSGLAICEAPTAWSLPTSQTVVGDGTAASCTETALAKAVSAGGHITFACGGSPVSIALNASLTVSKTTVIDGGGRITLNGGSKNRILIVKSNSALSVRNLRMINGAATQTMEAESIGGAISGQWRSKVEVINSTFENNTAGRGGGAVAVWTGSTLTISGSTFKNNTSWYGGAVYSLLSPLAVVNSVFSGNGTVTSGGLGDGGAIGTDGASEDPDDAVGGDVSICGSDISGNQGYGNGGGAYVWVYPPDRVVIDRVNVSNNAVGANGRNNNGLGGGMRVSNGEIVIRRSSFISNTSNNNGGGLYLDCAPSCQLINSTFYGNSAKAYGGAVFGDGHESSFVTYAGNSAGGHGGAIFGKNFIANNSIFSDNSAGNPWGQAMHCSSTGTGKNVLQWLSAKAGAGSDLCVSSVIARMGFLEVLRGADGIADQTCAALNAAQAGV